jgi:lysozyme family protein
VSDNFPACLAFTLKFEGGYVDHPRDPGGATNLGITHKTLARWRKQPVTKADVRALTKDEATKIYRAFYWDEVRASSLPRGLDLMTFDAAVNSGPARGLRWLATARNRAGGVMDQIKAYASVRLGFVQSLSTWPTFGRGWGRRIAECEVTALRMAGARSSDFGQAAGEASKAAKRNGTGAAGAGAGGAGAVSQAPSDDLGLAVFIVCCVVVLGVVAFGLWRAKQGQEARNEALAAAALEPATIFEEVSRD